MLQTMVFAFSPSCYFHIGGIGRCIVYLEHGIAALGVALAVSGSCHSPSSYLHQCHHRAGKHRVGDQGYGRFLHTSSAACFAVSWRVAGEVGQVFIRKKRLNLIVSRLLRKVFWFGALKMEPEGLNIVFKSWPNGTIQWNPQMEKSFEFPKFSCLTICFGKIHTHRKGPCTEKKWVHLINKWSLC